MTELRYFPGSAQTIEIVLDSAATAGALALLTLRMPAGDGAPPHRHTLEDETLLVREGDVVVGLDGVERTLAPGDAIFLARGALHAFRSVAGAVVDVVATPAGLEEFFRAVCPTEPESPGPDEATVAAALDRAGLDFSGE